MSLMLAPEEWDGGIPFAAPEHVAGRGLALPLGDDPVFDAQGLAALGVRPAGNVAGGENARRAGFEVFIDDHTTIDRQAGLRGEMKSRPHADPDHNELGIKPRAVVEPDPTRVNRGERAAEMKHNAM